MTNIGLGIPTYNGAERLSYLLRSISISRSGILRFDRLKVLDDGSPMPAARKVRQVCEILGVELLVHEENMGIAKSWNDLTTQLDTEVTILINDDVLVVDDWLRCLVYFLVNNQCGSASLPFYFINPEDAPHILRREEVIPRDPLTKQLASHKLYEIRESMTPGILMCPAGNIFGFTREMYDLVGGFDDKMFKSFFEESDFGTKLAEKGYKSYGLTYPMCWHVWSQTFRENPELEAAETIRRSQQNYCEKWGVPEEFFMHPFDYTNPKFMSKIQRQKVKWIGKSKQYEAWDANE